MSVLLGLLDVVLWPFLKLRRLLAGAPVIYSPQPGDCMGQSFIVSGTSFNGDSVTVTLTAPDGTPTTSSPVTANPDWDVSFTVTAPGTYTATATGSGGSCSVTFTVNGAPTITLNPPTTSPAPAPGPGPAPALYATTTWIVHVSGTSPGAPTGFLDDSPGHNHEKKLGLHWAAGQYIDAFASHVNSGIYRVRVESTDAHGNTVKTSRKVKVP